MRDEGPFGGYATGVDNTLRNAFRVETTQLFERVDVLKQDRPVTGYSLAVLVRTHAMPGLTGQEPVRGGGGGGGWFLV